MTLKFIGTVLFYVKNGDKVITRSDFAPELNLKVVDKNDVEIGYVSNVFGPVRKPYVAVKLRKNLGLNPFSLVGQPLFVVLRGKPGRGRVC